MMTIDHQLETLARTIMQQTGHQYIRIEHLFFALFYLPDEQQPSALRGIGLQDVEPFIQQLRRPICAAEVSGDLSASAKQVIRLARQDAGDMPLTADYLLASVLQLSPLVQKMMCELQLQSNQ